MFKVFHRTWWKENHNGQWPNNLEPAMGKKTRIGDAPTEDEARNMCRIWDEAHAGGRLSRKAEFEDA